MFKKIKTACKGALFLVVVTIVYTILIASIYILASPGCAGDGASVGYATKNNNQDYSISSDLESVPFEGYALKAHCGDGVRTNPEVCDGTDLGENASCELLGFDYGTLSCTDACWLDTSDCYSYGCGDGVADWPEFCDGDDVRGYDCEFFGYPGGTLTCTECVFDFSQCETNIPGWTCLPQYYAGSNGCHCGCGIVDPDCQDSSVDSCDFCNLAGACSTFDDCPGIIMEDNNAECDESVCGDGVAQGVEQCDASDLRQVDCTSLGLGYTEGVLGCRGDCLFDLTNCE